MEDMEQDPNKINDFQRQIDSRILKTGEEYAASTKRQRAENKTRQENRSRIKEMGISTHAYQIAVKVVKDLTANERADWIRDFQMVVKVLGSKQAELWPEEALKAEQRAQRAAEKKAKAGRTSAEMDAESDANPRSDPSAGGAQIDIEDAINAVTQAEAAEGDALLAGKSDMWRAGYNAVAAGGERGANPYVEGSAEARDWFAGFEAATARAFEQAAPAPETVPDGEVFNAGAGKPAAKPKKPSQSAKAKAARDAAQVP